MRPWLVQVRSDPETNPPSYNLEPIPDKFDSEVDYQMRWRPLCISEYRAQLISNAPSCWNKQSQSLWVTAIANATRRSHNMIPRSLHQFPLILYCPPMSTYRILDMNLPNFSFTPHLFWIIKKSTKFLG